MVCGLIAIRPSLVACGEAGYKGWGGVVNVLGFMAIVCQWGWPLSVVCGLMAIRPSLVACGEAGYKGWGG